MQLLVLSLVFCSTLFVVVSGMKILSSSSRQLNRRETNLVKRLVKRQALNDPNCDRRSCPPTNCGKDFVAAALPGECCEKCVPWEYAASLGIQYPQVPAQPPPPPAYDPRAQPAYQYPYNQAPQYQPQRVDVYIFGPDDGARVSSGQSIYFDCEVISPYNQYAQPRWSRAGNQPLPYKVQSTSLPGNRKLARLTIPDATQSEAGRYECSAGTGNPNDQASIDLQVTDGGYYPRPPPPQPQPQPQYPSYDPYNQYPYNQPGYYPPQPQPPPAPQPQPQPQPQPVPSDDGDDEGDDGDDAGIDDDQGENVVETTSTAKPTIPAAPVPAIPDEAGGEDEGEYPEDYTENEK